MNAPAIRQKYPFGDRAALWCNVCKRAQTPAEYIRDIPPMLQF